MVLSKCVNYCGISRVWRRCNTKTDNICWFSSLFVVLNIVGNSLFLPPSERHHFVLNVLLQKIYIIEKVSSLLLLWSSREGGRAEEIEAHSLEGSEGVESGWMVWSSYLGAATSLCPYRPSLIFNLPQTTTEVLTKKRRKKRFYLR